MMGQRGQQDIKWKWRSSKSRALSLFLEEREEKCGRVADLFEHEANLGFIPAVGTGLHTVTHPHGHTVLVSWYSRQDSIFTKWRVERFSSRRWFSFHMSNIFKIFCVTAIIVLSNKRVCEWACCSSLIWSCYIERTPNLLCNSVLVRREIQDVGNNAVRDEYDTTETLFPSICSFTLPLCPWAT